MQSGRTLLEMLAVLAIMGILTVGGIAAYSFAVAKHRAITKSIYVPSLLSPIRLSDKLKPETHSPCRDSMILLKTCPMNILKSETLLSKLK